VGIIKAKRLVWMAAVLCAAVVTGTMIGTAMANASRAQAAQAAESESSTIQHERVCGLPEGCTRNTNGDCGARSSRPCHGRS